MVIILNIIRSKFFSYRKPDQFLADLNINKLVGMVTGAHRIDGRPERETGLGMNRNEISPRG